MNLRLRVGLFVLTGLALLVVLTLLFSNFANFLKDYEQFTVVFKDAPGVGPGTPVRRSGIPVGQVKGVDLDDETGQVRVAILVEREHRPRHDDDVTLVRGLLGSDPTIDFVTRQPAKDRPPDRTPIGPGEAIAGVQGADVRNILTQTSELVPSTQDTLNEIRKSLARYEKMAPLVEDTLKEYRDLAKDTREKLLPDLRRTNDEVQVAARNWSKLGERLDVLVQTNQDKVIKTLDNVNETVQRLSNVLNDENQRNLAATLKNIRTGTDNLDSLAKNTEGLLKDSRKALDQVTKSLTRADEVLGNLQQATKPVAEHSAAILKNTDEIAAKLNALLTDLRNVTSGLNQGDGTVRRLLNDPSLYNNLNDAACMLVRILPRLDRVLHDVEVFADKIARHPESLGVRGAISPSSGLKEAPSNGGGLWPHR